MRSPEETGIIHFIGIGGIGMSAIAEVLANLGYQVRGSDMAASPNVVRLRSKGIAVAVGQCADNVEGASVVVYTSAVKSDNPEIAAARQTRIPVVRRAEMLAELMRLKRSSIAVAGTHGSELDLDPRPDCAAVPPRYIAPRGFGYWALSVDSRQHSNVGDTALLVRLAPHSLAKPFRSCEIDPGGWYSLENEGRSSFETPHCRGNCI